MMMMFPSSCSLKKAPVRVNSPHTCRASRGDALGGEERIVPVGNAMWRMDPMDALFYNILGESFVIRRGEGESSASGPSAQKARLSQLLRKNRHKTIVPRPANSPHAAAVKLTPTTSSLSVVDITELLSPLPDGPPGLSATVLAPSLASLDSSLPDDQSRSFAMSPPLHPVPSLDPADESYESSSPRRTVKCGFTCMRCQTRTFRMINPRAFSEGTLVVQCSNTTCSEWHKLTDHLGLLGDPVNYPDGIKLPLPPFYWKP